MVSGKSFFGDVSMQEFEQSLCSGPLFLFAFAFPAKVGGGRQFSESKGS